MVSKPAQKPSRKEDVLSVIRHLAISALFISPAIAASDAPESCDPPPDASVLVNVTETGAKGDAKTDDTAAIQAAIDKVAGSKGTVFLPDGTYMVMVGSKQGLNLKSDMTLKLSGGATIRAMPTKDPKYALLRVAGASNGWPCVVMSPASSTTSAWSATRSKASAINIKAKRASGEWASTSARVPRTLPSAR